MEAVNCVTSMAERCSKRFSALVGEAAGVNLVEVEIHVQVRGRLKELLYHAASRGATQPGHVLDGESAPSVIDMAFYDRHHELPMATINSRLSYGERKDHCQIRSRVRCCARHANWLPFRTFLSGKDICRIPAHGRITQRQQR